MAITLNFKEIGRILREDMKPIVEKTANEIAARVYLGNVEDAQVSVLMSETDRAHANITIIHPAGIAIEAKYGSLRRASASMGLEVHSK